MGTVLRINTSEDEFFAVNFKYGDPDGDKLQIKLQRGGKWINIIEFGGGSTFLTTTLMVRIQSDSELLMAN